MISDIEVALNRVRGIPHLKYYEGFQNLDAILAEVPTKYLPSTFEKNLVDVLCLRGGAVVEGLMIGPGSLKPLQGTWGESLPEIATLTGEITAGEHRVAQLELENDELRRCLEHHSAHKRFFRMAMAFQLFFSGTLLLQLVLKTPLISPMLAWTGVAVSAGVLLLSFMKSRESSERGSQVDVT